MDGKRFHTPARAATTVEFNSNSRLKEIVRISSEVSLVDKPLYRDDMKSFLNDLTGSSYSNVNSSIDRHISKMRYSTLKGFVIRPDGKAATRLFRSKRERYERLYDYSFEIAKNTSSDFFGLPFPHGIPVKVVEQLWQNYVVDRNDDDPYPVLFLDPSDKGINSLFYLMPFLKSMVKSSHTDIIGLNYTGAIRMQPLIRELIKEFKDSNVMFLTVGVPRLSNYGSLSGIHGQEMFMSDIIAMKSGRRFPPDGEDDVASNTPLSPLKVFEDGPLTIAELISLTSNKERAEKFLESVGALSSAELRKSILNALANKPVSASSLDAEDAQMLSDAFKLHELEISSREIESSRQYARQGEVKTYVNKEKPSLKNWLRQVSGAI